MQLRYLATLFDIAGERSSTIVFPIPMDTQLPEVALRGMATVIPGLSKYFDQIPKPSIDGGYYARTPENRPLIGPLPVDGAYLVGGFGGFGMQVSWETLKAVASTRCGRLARASHPAKGSS